MKPIFFFLIVEITKITIKDYLRTITQKGKKKTRQMTSFFLSAF